MNQELFEYIRQKMAERASLEDIKKYLISAGWSENEINNAINLILTETPTSQTQSQYPVGEIKTLGKIGKFRASYLLVTESFELLKSDKEIMFFPVLSALFNLIIVGFLAVFFYTTMFIAGVKDMENPQGGFGVLNYIFIFLAYLASIFISTFFNAGVVLIVNARINGKNLSFGGGMKESFRNIRKIFLWALTAATIGIILKIIFEKSKLLGKIVVYFLGAAWGVVTFFIVPVLILENKRLVDSIKDSAIIFKRTWGETLIMNFSTGLFFGFIYLALFILFIVSLFSGSVYIIISSAVVFLASMVLLMVISSTLNVIFKVVLYEYARYGKIPENFTPELILGAIKKKV